jgi:tetratricopeptide (TPR) repeat protein
MDIEKELFRLKRDMTSLYSKGLYHDALEVSLFLENQVKQEMGTNNAIYASCLNNIALMHKMLGNNTDAMDAYTEALHIYQDVKGKKHVSYAATLANLGALYKTMATGTKGMEKLQLLERAEEALFDAKVLRTELLGPTSRETIYSCIHLSSVWNIRGKEKEARQLLLESLDVATREFGRVDVITATILNNLGLMHKSNKMFAAANECYSEALNVRTEILGESHPDTIVTMHNIAELLLAQGQVGAAAKLQEKVRKEGTNQPTTLIFF